MKDLELYAKYFTKPTHFLQDIATKPIAAFATLFSVCTWAELSTTQQTMVLLAVLFVMDFITGIGASYVEFKKALPVTPGAGKRYVLSSTKMKLSAVKFITYAFGIICAFIIESIFVKRELNFEHITTAKMTLTTVVTVFFCAIEFYSIFFENIKRMGLDLIQKVKDIAKSAWSVSKAIKNENDEDSSKI